MAQTKLPDEIESMSQAFTSGLGHILGSRLYGVYQYGSAEFPDDGAIQDFECHVILKRPLSEGDRAAIRALQADLATWNPNLCKDVYAYYVLFSEARKTGKPVHQLDPLTVDTSWALHCAHIRAGYYRTLLGPEPTKIFPPPSWEAVSEALESELANIQNRPHHPACCILNLCKIIYTYNTRISAVTKRASGLWACQQFPAWDMVIMAAIRYYRQEQGLVDEIIMSARMPAFLGFVLDRLAPFLSNHTH